MGKSVEVRDYVKIAADYAKDVRAGRVLACRYVKQACARHLDGLRDQKKRAYAYRLDEAKAVKVCGFVELLPHVKGKWARDHQTIRLEPWQCFILVNVFGWLRKSDGLRRYRRVYIEVPRKNSKSTTTAGVGEYMLVADGEFGAEVYSGATSEKQAWEVFGPARLMAKNTPALQEQFGVTVGAKNLHVIGTASKFEPIIGKPGDGASPSFSVTDEYHEHATSEQLDAMITGMGAREQPIAWVITTAGSDTAGPCYALRQQAADMLAGTVDHPELFAIIYTIDENIPWDSDDALRMANPNIGVSVFEGFLKSERDRAVKTPRDQATFKTKHLCVWVTAASPFFNADAWKALTDTSLAIDQFRGEPCVASFDLASKLDIAATLKLFQRIVDEKKHYYVFAKFYVPLERTKRPEFRHYAGWIEEGFLIGTPGNMIDFDYIEADLKADCTTHSMLRVGGDPWNAGQLITHMQNHIGEDRVVEIPQTVLHLSEPMKEIQATIEDGRIHHDGNPILTWMLGNVTAREDRNENVFPRKESEERKIDGATALIGAMALRAAFEETPVTSRYDTEPLFVL